MKLLSGALKNEDLSNDVFNKMLFCFELVLLSYTAFYLIIGASFASAVTGAGALILNPLLFLVSQRGYAHVAKHLFVFQALAYVYLTSLSFGHSVSADDYYFPIMMLPFLIFTFRGGWQIFAFPMLTTFTWIITQPTFLPSFASSFSYLAENVHHLSYLNGAGACLTMVAFLLIFMRTVRSLKDQVVSEKEKGSRLMAEKVRQLETTNTRLENILEGAGLGSWDWNLENNSVHFDRRWYKMLDLDPESAPPDVKTWSSRIHPDDLGSAFTDIQRYLDGKTEIYESVHRMRSNKGSWVWILDRGRISERDGEGKPKRFTGTHFDITKRKEEELLSESVQRIANIGWWEIDISAGATKWSHQALLILGHSSSDGPEPQMGASLFVSSERERIVNLIARGLQGERHSETLRYVDRQGKAKWLEVFEVPILGISNSVAKLVGTIRDVTEQKNASDLVAKTSRELNQFFALTLDLFCICKTDGCFLKVNRSWSSLGYGADDLIAFPLIHFVHPDDIHLAQAELTRATNGEKVQFVCQFRCKDGSYRILSWAITKDPSSHLLYIAARDVTLQRESDRLLEEAQRVARIGSWSFDLSTKEIRWSEQMYRLFPGKREQGPPTYQEHYETIHPEDRKHWEETVNKCAQDGKEYRMRFRSVFPDGSVLWIQALGEGFRGKDGRVRKLSGTCQDVTELVLAEEQIKKERAKAIHASKLASLGEIAAGIAHEINNPLAIISASSQVLSRSRSDQKRFEEKVDQIQRSVARIEKIVNGLRKFSRSSTKPEYKIHSLRKILDEVAVLTMAKAKRHATSVIFECETEGLISCDEIEIEQVLLNLINNGIDAVKDSSERWVKVLLVESAQNIVLKVTDSGKGIPEAIRQKLFQPFFTTKAVREGTGLGLSIAKGILDEHNASIEVLAEEANTCFEVRFNKVEVIQDVA